MKKPEKHHPVKYTEQELIELIEDIQRKKAELISNQRYELASRMRDEERKYRDLLEDLLSSQNTAENNEEYFIEIYSDAKKVSTHAIWKALKTGVIQIRDFIVNSEDAEFALVIKTTHESPEHFKAIILRVSETTAEIPIMEFDTSLYQMEMIVIPLEEDLQKERYTIRMEYRILD